jgi:small subunit ribosomal protein S31
MTLVLNGISQNSFLNIKEKQEIIEWYRSYFEEKKDIINDALEAERMEAEYLQATQTQK